MKKKGFTLIELLAVIVILAIIALIAVPIIMNIIDRSKGGVYDRQRDMVADAAELYYFKYSDELVWEDDIAYVEVGRLKETGYLREKILNPLNNQEIPDETKVLIYKEDGIIKYSLQLYDNDSFKWYQQKMIASVKSMDIELPTEIGEKTTVDLNTLIDQGKAAEIRIPTDITNRCVGYVDIEKIGPDNYIYEAYVDCLLDASTFASHYVSYGGKYLDEFNDVKETSDGGYIAVGSSNSEVITKYGTEGKGSYDAIIVKFDINGNVLWSKNFGGSNNDYFYSVVELADGYAAVGQTSSNDGDIETYRGGQSDALIVKFSKTGEVLFKRSYGTAGNGNEAFSAIVNDNNKLVVTGNILLSYTGDLEEFSNPNEYRSRMAVNVVFDQELNVVDTSYFGGTSEEHFSDIIIDSEANYINVGRYASNNIDVLEFDCPLGGLENQCAIIVKYDSDFNVLGKFSFNGSGVNQFVKVVEVSDGYIAVGSARANDLDMEDISKADNGYNDAIIVKFDKNLENIIWKKSFGGSNEDVFNSLVKANETEVLVVGYSISTDMDMNGLTLSGNGYKTAVLVRYNISDGSLVSKKSFGGTNSEVFNTVIKDSGSKFIVAGATFSNDGNLKNFNKGHSDAALIGYDINTNLAKIFQEPVVIIDKLKTIVPNYGTDISMKYENIYTSNDPTVDLLNWCSLDVPHIDENPSNYYYGKCLRPFNADDSRLLVDLEVPRGLKINAGEHEYVITTPSEDTKS